MQKQAFKWTSERVKEVLKDVFGLEDYEIDEMYGGDLSVKATSETPAIYYDSYTHKLTIEYPEEDEELPNPDGDFYPNLEYEYPTVEAVKQFIKEELGEDVLKEVEDICKDVKEEPGVYYRKGDPYYDCLVEQAYDKMRERLAEELQESVAKLEKSKPKHYEFCGVPVTVKTDVYEETKYNKAGGEYTAYMPSTVFVIDLDKVPDEETLKCVLEKIQEPGEWWH